MADWGTSPWRVDVAVPAVPVPRRTGAVVIGAGLTGLSAAYHLARAGVPTAVLEAGTIGAGASGRTGAIALEGTAAGSLPGADDCLATLARVTDEAGVDCDLRLDGCHELVHESPPGTGTLRWRDGDRVLAVAGIEPGGTLDPGALLAGLSRAAVAAGATVHARVAATAIDPGSPPTVRTAAGDAVVAEHVVVALNAYTTTIVRLPLAFSAALTLALSTPPLTDATLDALGLGARLPFYTQDLPYLWGRTLADGRLVLGSGLVFADDVRRVDLRDAAGALATLETRMRGFHPALADVPVTQRWGGPIAFLSRPPLVGRHPDVPAAIVTGGYAGHGVALSVQVGALVARAIADGAPLPAWGAF